MENVKYNLFQGDCLKLLKDVQTETVDAVITDPPYQYLNTKKKNCHFDMAYNVEAYIEEVKRCLKDTGFIVMFGRGVSFYRQGVLLDKAGFKFKEEIIWNKRKPSSPVLPLGRQHENCFIFAKTKKGIIRKTRVPIVEYLKGLDIKDAIARIKNNIRKINEEIKKPEIFKDIMLFINQNIESYTQKCTSINYITHNVLKKSYRSVQSIKIITQGYREVDIMNIPDIIEEASLKCPNHPTEKPVRLMERLIALVTNEGDLVLDSFMGSGTTGVACMNMKRRFIGMELNEIYFKTAVSRLNKAEHENTQKLTL